MLRPQRDSNGTPRSLLKRGRKQARGRIAAEASELLPVLQGLGEKAAARVAKAKEDAALEDAIRQRLVTEAAKAAAGCSARVTLQRIAGLEVLCVVDSGI